ncbi:hypothetical protein [Marivirga atlantica]|uniref:Uncharacterized protein n=1 Tax=Marivirga atlantica TaxID=1548457 RepID=A0A937AN55_9BACT|nr:hypothetical protein [Marivirga atlantica]MBL0765762.1 hypothetical protein [Marivirga atlantica]
MRYLLLLIILIGSSSLAFSQKKVKYKNLFPILQSKDYKAAESDLLIYLADNDDEASAYFYLGEVIISKLDTIPIFPTSDTYDSLIDKAVDAYTKAIALVDEKEVRKNDEYYMAYNRRDLRTGKFGIKVSDVHLDYENKIESLVKKKELVKDITTAKAKAIEAQDALTEMINSLQTKYPNREAFLLRISTDEQSIFDRLLEKSKSLKEAVETYENRISSLNNKLYQVQIVRSDITSWEELSSIKVDFERNTLQLPDYEKYFNELQEELRNEIAPLKKILLEIDQQLTDAIEKNSSVQDSSQLYRTSIPTTLIERLVKFSTSPLAISVLKYKSQKTDLAILENAQLFPVLNDSTNVYQRTNKVEEIYEGYKSLKSTLKLIEKDKREESVENFAFYLNRFKPSFNEYLVLENTVVDKKIEELSDLTDSLKTKVQFVIHEDDTLSMPEAIIINEKPNRVSQVIELPEYMLAAGKYKDSTFVASIGYNMEMLNLISIDSTESVVNFIPINNDYLLNVTADSLASFKYALLLINSNGEILWKHNYSSNDKLSAAKIEAGIYFIYNEEEEIYLTLSSKGEKIGQ